MASHTDNLLLFGKKLLFQQLKQGIPAKVDSGSISYHRDIEISRNFGSKSMTMSQHKFNTEYSTKFGKASLKPAKSPS